MLPTTLFITIGTFVGICLLQISSGWPHPIMSDARRALADAAGLWLLMKAAVSPVSLVACLVAAARH